MLEKGITKIEILIVVFIILVIIIVNIFVFSYLNSKSQDIQVLSEVSQIISSLELFLLSNDFYPAAKEPLSLNDVYSGTEKLCLSGFKKLTDPCQKNILAPIPNQDYNKGNRYYYKTAEDNKDYQLEFVLKTNFKRQGLLKGKNCVTSTGIISQPCF